jgi:hypothetical protein
MGASFPPYPLSHALHSGGAFASKSACPHKTESLKEKESGKGRDGGGGEERGRADQVKNCPLDRESHLFHAS